MDISYDVVSTLRANMKQHEPIVLIYDARGNGTGGVSNAYGRSPKPNHGLHSDSGGGEQ